MATYKAISNGNADTLAIWEIWNGAAWVAATALPSASDDVYTNNNIVTITTPQSYLSFNKSSVGAPLSIAQGGQFQITGANEITLSGQVNGSNVYLGGNNPLSACVNRLSTHTNTLHRVGDDVGGSANYCYGFWNGSTYDIDLVGNQQGGGGNYSYGFYNNAAATFTSIVGNQQGGSGNSSYGFHNNAAGLIITFENSFQKTGVYQAVYNNGDSTTINFINCRAYTNSIYNSKSTATINFQGITYNDLQNGTMAIKSLGNVNFDLSVFYIGLTPTYTDIALYPASTLENPPVITDVRSGVVYGIGNNYTGTLAVPPAESVVKNVPVDDTVGTYALSGDLIKRLEKCATTEEVDSSIPAELQSRLENVAEKDDINNAKIEIITEMSNIDIDLTNIATKEDINNIDFSQASGNKGSKRIID